MAEHLLDRAQVGACVEHMGREAMAQAVRRERRVDTRARSAAGRRYSGPTRVVSRPPRKFVITGPSSVHAIGIALRHALSASSAGSPSGTIRSLLPLPARTITIPSSSSMSRQQGRSIRSRAGRRNRALRGSRGRAKRRRTFSHRYRLRPAGGHRPRRNICGSRCSGPWSSASCAPDSTDVHGGGRASERYALIANSRRCTVARLSVLHHLGQIAAHVVGA